MDKEQWQQKGKGHRSRLRDRFLANGLSAFSDAEILELLLSFGTPRSDCKEPARELLVQFGSLARVLEASPTALTSVKGVGPKNGFAIAFIQAVASHYLKQRLEGKHYLHSSAEVRDYLIHSMRGLKKEIFSVIFLDSSQAIITTEILSEGTVNVNTVYPREILIKALQHNAAALILAHNHPSGSLQPSAADIKLTKMIALICSQMQLQLLDHIIVGDGAYSFADSGKIARIQQQCREIIATATAG